MSTVGSNIRAEFGRQGISVWGRIRGSRKQLKRLPAERYELVRDSAQARNVTRAIVPPWFNRAYLGPNPAEALRACVHPRLIFSGDVLNLKKLDVPIPEVGEAGREDWIEHNEADSRGLYGRHAATFEHLTGVARGYELSIYEGIDLLIQHLKACGLADGLVEFLDVGVGPAFFLRNLLTRTQEEGIEIKVEGVELQEKLLDRARAVCQTEGFADRVTLHHANAAKMTEEVLDGTPIVPGSKHAAALSYLLTYAPAEEVLTHTNRALVDGGLLLVTNHLPQETNANEIIVNVRGAIDYGKNKRDGHGILYELGRFFWRFIKKAPKIVGFGEAIDRSIATKNMQQHRTYEELRALLEEYGFQVIEESVNQESHYGAAVQLVAVKIRDV